MAWQPSEIIINTRVLDDPITQHILAQCPGVPVIHVADSKSETIKAASSILQRTAQEMLPQIQAGKLILHIAPCGNDVVDSFEIEDARMMCPEFDRLKFASNGCFYNCDWCFLKATYRTMQNYITVRVEYDKIKEQLTKRLSKATGPIMFNTGEMADSLALDHLTLFSQNFVPWFAQQPNGYLYLLSKSTNVDGLLEQRGKHQEHTIATWSINNAFVSDQFEIGAPTFSERLRAAKRVQDAGYPVRLRLDPIVPIQNWKHFYAGTIRSIFEVLTPDKITLGTLRFEENLYNMRNTIFVRQQLKDLAATMTGMLPAQPNRSGKTSEGKWSFPTEQRVELFRFALAEIKKYSATIPVALCKESDEVWGEVGLDLKQCECVCKFQPVDMIQYKEARMAAETTAADTEAGKAYRNRQKYDLKISELTPDKDQPRKHFDPATLEELKNSIEKHGVLQPILFRKDDKRGLIIVSGERRYQASKLAGKETIPAIFITSDAREISLVENLLRQDLNPIEEAEALEILKAEKKYTLNELSAVIGKAPSTISEILSLNNLPSRIKNKCRQNIKVSRRALVEIAKAGNEEAMKKLFKKYEKNELTGDQLREETRGEGRAERPLDATLMTMIGGLTTKIEGVSLTDIDEGKRQTVRDKLEELIRKIQEKLN